MFFGSRPTLKGSSGWLITLLRLVDSTMVALLLYPIAIFHTGGFPEHYDSLLILSFFLSLAIFQLSGLYRPWRGQDYLAEFRTLLAGWSLFMCVVLFFVFALKVGPRYSRVVLTSWFLLTPVALIVLHGLARRFLRYIRSMGKNIRSAVIVGARELGLSVADYILAAPWAGIRVIGFFDDFQKTEDLGQINPNQKPLLGTLAELPGYLHAHHVDLVYITLPMRLEKEIQSILTSCRTLGARIYLVPDLYAFRSFNNRIERFGDILLLDFNPDAQSKRLFDIVFSLTAILAMLPVGLLIALFIKLQDGGSVFYGHRRVTVAGKRFSCLKFRTMHVAADRKLKEILERDPEAMAEWDKNFKLKKDPRITWMGRFLRKTSLDELPQFINVLKGEMSVVGARPIVGRELTEYYKENGGVYCSLKPGVTGIWQVSKRNDTEEYQERVQLDTWYVLNRNFWLDMKIIGKTVVSMLRGNGAY